MSAAFSLMNRLHHSLLFMLSPGYRRVRQRLESIGQPAR